MSYTETYEFLAVDRPLTPAAQVSLQRLSSRAEISATRLAIQYHFGGSLKDDPGAVLLQHFDLGLFLDSVGTRTLWIRLPRAVLEPTELATWLPDARPTATSATHIALRLGSDDPDSPRPDLDHPDWLPRLQGVREALLLGDRRPLYLAWLAALDDAPRRPDAAAPCVPPGLQALPESHQALAEFLRLEPFPLQAAAEASPPVAEPSTDLCAWTTALPEADKTAWLLRLLGEEAAAARFELRRRHLHETTPPSAPGPRLTPTAIQDRARALSLQAHAKAKRRAAEARDRRAAAAAQARQQHLDHLATRLPDVWLKVRNLIDEGQPKPYDQAIALLQDLRDLARQRDHEPAFEQALAALRQQYARRVGFNQRLAKAGLDGKPPPAPSPAPPPIGRR